MNISVEPKGWVHTVRLYGGIGAAEAYEDLFEVLGSASPQDDIVIHINTHGGNLDTVVSLVEALRNCRGVVTTIAEGTVASGGSLIFFSGHQLLVGDFVEVLLHDASIGGLGGKSNELSSLAWSSKKTISNLYHNVYGAYFSKKEINKVLKGQDLYLDASELKVVLDKFCESLEG